MMKMHPFVETLRELELVEHSGVIRCIMPTYMEADGPAVALGSLCTIQTNQDDEVRGITAEVVKVNERSITLVPLQSEQSTFIGAKVRAISGGSTVPVGDGFLGRVVDALGQPIDDGPPIPTVKRRPLHGVMTSPLDRRSPIQPLRTGIRAIDSILTLGQGQRIGIFAGSGVGKTTLMTQLAAQIEVDCCVMCLVGERGREAEAFWSSGLSRVARERAVMIVATADQPAAMRVRAAYFALSLAEHLRESGKHVLLVLDSVTRLAMAMREIGLAAGEPPTIRAYTPSVFAAIPRLIERCGALKSSGAITAVLTVLTETDDADDPIAELMKSLLDGHIILSRELAEQGHFPAIDIPRSISRMSRQLMTEEQRKLAAKGLAELALYESSRTLIETGLYAAGSNPEIDQALKHRSKLIDFLKQTPDTRFSFEQATQVLTRALEEVNSHA